VARRRGGGLAFMGRCPGELVNSMFCMCRRRIDGTTRPCIIFHLRISTAPALEFSDSLGSSGTGNFGFKVLTDAAYF
jgi:hypothetical protein